MLLLPRIIVVYCIAVCYFHSVGAAGYFLLLAAIVVPFTPHLLLALHVVVVRTFYAVIQIHKFAVSALTFQARPPNLDL